MLSGGTRTRRPTSTRASARTSSGRPSRPFSSPRSRCSPPSRRTASSPCSASSASPARCRLVGVRDWRVYGVARALAARLHRARPLPSHAGARAAARRRLEDTGPAVHQRAPRRLRDCDQVLRLAAGALARRACGKCRAVALAAVLPLASVLLVLPFTGLDQYLGGLLRVGRAFDDDSYTLFGLVVQAGGPEPVARASNVAGRRRPCARDGAVSELHARRGHRARRVADRVARLLRPGRRPGSRSPGRGSPRSGSCRS